MYNIQTYTLVSHRRLVGTVTASLLHVSLE